MLNTRQRKIKRRLKRLAIVLISLYIIGGAFLYFEQEKILFHPSVLPQDFNYEFPYPFEELFLQTDGANINALHFKIDNPKGVVLYFHGNAGDLSRWGIVTQFFVKKQYDVLVIDYRTYGKSTGELSESALYNDSQYCYDYLKQHYSESDITVYGRSLGTGMATYVASKNKPKQLILETPYYSMTDVAKSKFPIFPIEYMLKYKLPSYKFISQVNCPISMFHGTNDRIVPYESAQKLFKEAPAAHTTFTTLDGGSHFNLIKHETFLKRANQIL
ncbi:alpha/beta hydrolase [Flavivirga eckloniae]|uniref:Alpha/beta hydrolase n=1 Tax=Flavivirga eckloniae TaxID=1803846 RepID=A0A2K9PNK5_9FLAO|nr:alpha/beta hydrolase [Flavivirga eckloniae]AUP78634.1 alpha/beta hydrolase [Flavivirga eckloniae]